MSEGITQFRLCGGEWRYCNGLCAQCPLTKTYYSTSATTDCENMKCTNLKDNTGSPLDVAIFDYCSQGIKK